MSSWLLACIFALGVATWAYAKLARSNGNSDPKANLMLAVGAGAIVFLFFISLLKLVLNFE